jgi:hypothetical protein
MIPAIEDIAEVYRVKLAWYIVLRVFLETLLV